MRTTPIPALPAAALVGGLVITGAHAQDKTPGFNQKSPEKIMTPDEVETWLGTLPYVNWVPLRGFLVDGKTARTVVRQGLAARGVRAGEVSQRHAP